MLKYLKSKRGSSIIELPFVVLVVMFLLALFLKVSPAFLMKQSLDTYATELCRVAEISGRVGDETTAKENQLNDAMGITPDITWSKTGKIQQNDTFTVTCSMTYDLGLFANIGSFPVQLAGHATGTSEEYWK